MNILYCIPHLYNSGGMERVLTQKVNWLATHTNYQFTILTTERTPQGMKDVWFALNERVQVVSLAIGFDADYSKPLLSKWWHHMQRMRQYQQALEAYIRTNSIDLCISLGGKEIAFLHQLPCRTIAELHFAKDHRRQLLMANHSGWFWSLLGTFRTRQLVRDVRKIAHVIALTQKDQEEWRKAGCTNVTVIPNPCALDGRKMPIPSDKKKTVLAVGRLHEQKGFDLLLRAWGPIEKQYPDWSLRIVGEGPKRAELESQIREQGLQHVALAGRAEDIVKEYATASLFVLSSRYEGLPLALIEAMWSGLPCIAFDCPHGPAELLAQGRGWLVSNGDIAALTKQIEYVLLHPDEAAQRAQAAQTYAQQTYSESVIMPKWMELIESRF